MRRPVPAPSARAAAPPAPSARAAALALATVLVACTGGGAAVQPLPPPPSTRARPPTTPPPDHRAVTLPVAGGGRSTTTAVPMGPGLATVRGRVVGPDGTAVVGANVRVDRLVGNAMATMELLSGEDGAWSLPNVLGGRYRIRAWRPPDLAQMKPGFLFVGAEQNAPLEQKLERHFGTTPIPAIAPNPPVAGQPANLEVQITSRSVDAAGVVQGVPLASTPVELAGGTWSVAAPNPASTDGSGRVRWRLVCRQAGAQPLRLVVNGVEQFQLALPACAEPPAPPPPESPDASTPAAPTTTGAGVTTTRPSAPPTTRRTAPSRPRAP